LIKQRDSSAAKQNYGWEWEYNGWNGAILQIGCEMIEHPVDAVPVIRCKDCKHYEEQDETIGTCLLTESGAHIKGYCSWAERKEE